jgi:hypothetical protein
MRKVKLVKHSQLVEFLQTSCGKFRGIKCHLSGRNRQKLVQNRIFCLRDFEHAAAAFDFRLCSLLA